MATASRTIDFDLEQGPLRDLLAHEPFRVKFFQAVRLLRRLEPERNGVGTFVHPDSEVVRFSARQSLTFPPSEVHEIEFKQDKPARMTVNFMGLTGPQGILPLFYSEFVLDRLRKRDTASADFLDIFNHRIISLFYQAWEKYYFAARFERGEQDRLSRNLLDLIGLGTAGLQRRLQPEIEDETLLYHAGLLGQRPHSAVALQQILSDYFAVPVEIVQFSGIWHRLDKKDQTCLDEGFGWQDMLGTGAVVGDEVFEQQSLVRIRLGPLTLAQYLSFLPTGHAYSPLRSLVRFYSGDDLEYEVQLVLKRQETPPTELGAELEAGPRLGWVTWMKSVPLARDPSETVIRL